MAECKEIVSDNAALLMSGIGCMRIGQNNHEVKIEMTVETETQII